MTVTAPRLCLVGPLPPPSGGMANQCEQLLRLWRQEGLAVTLVRNNAPYAPAWIGRVPVLRAGFRLLPYLWQLWTAAGRSDVMHVLANSGWAWHLFAWPAVVIARLRGCAVIVNYRGGHADQFFSHGPRHVLRTLASAQLRVTPSAFLLRVFGEHGLDAEVIPNIIDLTRFAPAPRRDPGDAPHLIVTRNLEPIYDIGTALRAFAIVRRTLRNATLTVAGSGPDLAALRRQAASLGIAGAVRFSGRIDNAQIGALYASADCVLNPSTVDNMPISILEAFASGVPTVSTDAGGIPDLLTHGVDGLLVPIGDAEAMANAALNVLQDAALAERLRQAGLHTAQRYAWPRVREQWLDAYRRAAGLRGRERVVA
ncbi:glycosyltransferase family 4 protein [Aquabacterium humicola]|uniref:glycosyltransferase family 4 protein n=1 Tax=Aquabacterium humicola TaxID=3237377 RepID=UPI002543A6DB|nr:glycosyltransferase family 4 protein [Rubrivivax pictus]